jgi:anti-anti-sigma regulatory factor
VGRVHQLLAQELAVLGLDLRTTLEDEPRFLLDRDFLGSLHVELAEQLGAEDARAALLQLGFLHGLRDAARIVLAGFGPSLETRGPGPTAPRLAFRLDPVAGDGLVLRGAWPERIEADAVVGLQGARAHPACHLSAGYTSGWLSAVFDADLLAVERTCAATGAPQCSFEAREPEDWAASGALPDAALPDALPFRELREIVGRHLDSQPLPSAPSGSEAFERGSPVVHVWGPVMVIPFSGAEESLRAVELIGRDPGARQVRVVVVDLSGTLIDEGFGAAALEQVFDAIESWGAEPVLTGVSPLCQHAVAGLERSHLVIHKDLPEAIAAGFQIAQALRRGT